VDALDQGHRVGGDVPLAVSPIQEACQGGLLTGATGRTEAFERGPEATDRLGPMIPMITIILTGKLCEPTGPHVSLCSQKPWRRRCRE
jgi:hypothetical protein